MPGASSDDKINALRRRLSGKNALTVDQLSIIVDIEETPEIYFKNTTPELLKQSLEELRFSVEPLGNGELKGILYENGGGYRTQYGGDGYIQFHPENGSHHGGAYYKISCGRYGRRRFDLNGGKRYE